MTAPGRFHLGSAPGTAPEAAAIVALPHADGLAVHAPMGPRLLPWEVARDLVDDPDLGIVTAAPGDLSPWDGDRLLTALVAGDPQARSLCDRPWPPPHPTVQELRRYPRRWRRTIDLGVLVGDVEAACCRAGLALPGSDPLDQVATLAVLAERAAGAIAVRERLHRDHPWVGDAAFLSASGSLAEQVVLEERRRDAQREPVRSVRDLPVADLLGRPERFRARRADVRAAMAGILDGRVGWSERGHLDLRPAGSWSFTVGGVELGLGVGGLHSADAPGMVDGPISDLDVASYYPGIIVADRIAPAGFAAFPDRVRAVMEGRLAAKRSGDTVAANALKIVVNSLYGQLGNHRSTLFAPAGALRVVLTGQLRLLQLIDGILEAGGELLSANTDGILVRGGTEAAMGWQAETGLTLERSEYQRLWRTSINDYVALAADGSIKTKGRFGGGDDEETATRRAAAPIIARAAVEHLVHGRPIADTVAASDRCTDFTLWRRANGLHWGEEPITARVARWIAAREGQALVQITKERQRSTVAAKAILVPDPDAIPLTTVDRDWYIAEAQHLVDRVLGTDGGAKQLSLLD